MEFLETHGNTAYAIAFFGTMGLVCLWETLSSKRQLVASLRQRWFGNFSIYFISIAFTRLLFPGVALVASAWAANNNFGLFNRVEVPAWIVVPAVLLTLDFSRYGSHWLLHNVPLLWRIHGMHHTDQDYDFTTSFRFHPLEAVFFFSLTMCVVALIGAPLGAIALAEVLFVAISLFSHGNVNMPTRLDAWARKLVVTPDLHRVHHSIIPQESNANFGNLFSFWDRLLGTYIDQPSLGHEAMTIGLEGYEDPENLTLRRMLIHPFMPAPQEGAAPARQIE